MRLLIFYFIWFLSYITTFFFYKIIFIIFYRNKNKNLPKFKNFNFLIKYIFILFYNKQSNFYDGILTLDDTNYIEKERFTNWPITSLIHGFYFKINTKKNILTKIKSFLNFFSKKQKKKKNFKQNYKFYNFLNQNNLLNNLNLNNKIEFIILNKFLLFKFNLLLNKKVVKNDKILLLLLVKNSMFNQHINVIKLNENNNNILNYINIYETNKYLNSIQLILKNNSNNSLVSNVNFNNYKSYINNFIVNNNYIYNTNKKIDLLNVNFNLNFLNELRDKYLISFSATNIVKYINNLTKNNINILYLRKNKVFNKSRYSRNRQTYRTGVYWCLYINIIAIIAFYFWFYKFTINFGYMWWLLFTFISSFFVSRSLKYRLYNLKNLINELILGFKWFTLIILKLLKFVNINNYISYIQNIILNNLYYIGILRKYNDVNFIQLNSIYNYILQLNNYIILLLK